jgi:hypothetical protein
VFETELNEIMEKGAGLVIGTVSADGEPRGARAWSAAVIDADPPRLRVVFTADDPVVVANLESGSVAFTAADVCTFRSMQLKGRVLSVGSPTEADLALAERLTDTFFYAVHITDGNPLELLDRVRPVEVAVLEMTVEEQFDQTPGPDAGARIGTGRT